MMKLLDRSARYPYLAILLSFLSAKKARHFFLKAGLFGDALAVLTVQKQARLARDHAP
jgi:hypothetical protein